MEGLLKQLRRREEHRYFRFFDRFYRQDESHNSEKSGFGIGLSMAKEIVEHMRGKLKFGYEGDALPFTVDV